MPTTMNLIARQTVGAGGAASVTFSNIPQTFTDLKIVMSAKSDLSAGGGGQVVRIKPNNSTSTSGKFLSGNGSSASSGNDDFIGSQPSDWTANTFGNTDIYITNYRSSNFKSFSSDGVGENNATRADAWLTAGLWSSNDPITSIVLTPYYATNFLELSDFSLYGISNSQTQNQSAPLALGGDIIRTDGSFWYHTFLYSGTFVPLKQLTCDYLVVAGAGGGGSNGGGGGAGGYRTSIGGTALSLIANTAYSASIGAGGAGAGNGTYVNGSNGSNSIFSTITSTGGGGGSGPGGGANNGGSGGGGGWGGGTSTRGLASPTGQGNNGGAGIGTAAGGGGGANAVGADGVSSTSGNGGNGSANSISGSSITYAGGGGGGGGNFGVTPGNGGTGGGGNGGLAGSNGTANLGGGGGGGGGNGGAGGTGGSGIIIVRYPV